ncbi:MAG: DAHL domain-containing protein, partial [Cyanobacteria bacterium P01_D01_bin.56]
MTRVVPPKVLLISTCLFVLLTVCFWGSLGYSSASQADINTYFRRLERTDLFIVNDVLKTRFQLLQHYGTITQNTLRFEQDLSYLQKVIAPRGNAAISTALSNLQQAQTERNTQVEDFKTDFSVLSNSLNYLPRISQLALQVSLIAGDSTLSEAIRQLQVNLLVDTLGSDTIEQNSVMRDLNTVAQASLTADGEFKSLLQNLIQHVQVILRVRDDTQNLLEGISQNSVQNQIEQLASTYNAHQEEVRQRANRYRSGLYILSLTLIFYFIYLYRYQKKNRFLQSINQSLENQVAERTQALRATMDQLQTSQIQLVQQEKMSALGNLVAGVAHEINNPIGFVRGNVKELRRNLTDVFEYLKLYQQQAPQETIEAHAEAVDMDFLLEDMPKMLVSMETGCDRIH